MVEDVDQEIPFEDVDKIEEEELPYDEEEDFPCQK